MWILGKSFKNSVYRQKALQELQCVGAIWPFESKSLDSEKTFFWVSYSSLSLSSSPFFRVFSCRFLAFKGHQHIPAQPAPPRCRQSLGPYHLIRPRPAMDKSSRQQGEVRSASSGCQVIQLPLKPSMKIGKDANPN